MMFDWNHIGFYIIILVTNIIQGITGFAGTILAMPFSIQLVGYNTAKPILNVLGILSGAYVFVGNRKRVSKYILRNLVILMGGGMLIGFVLKRVLRDYDDILYLGLGIFILYLAITGLARVFFFGQKSIFDVHIRIVDEGEKIFIRGRQFVDKGLKKFHMSFGRILVVIAGIVHGIFVCGGPVMVGYLTQRIKSRAAFRATISTMWIILNSIILATDIAGGLWTRELVIEQCISIPFLAGGMFIGGILYKHMSQRVFMILTYVLLLVAGLSILLK